MLVEEVPNKQKAHLTIGYEHMGSKTLSQKFRLPFDIFLKLYDMTISNGWYDPHRKDCTNGFLITEERFYQSAAYTQEQEMTNT